MLRNIVKKRSTSPHFTVSLLAQLIYGFQRSFPSLCLWLGDLLGKRNNLIRCWRIFVAYRLHLLWSVRRARKRNHLSSFIAYISLTGSSATAVAVRVGEKNDTSNGSSGRSWWIFDTRGVHCLARVFN